MRDIGPQSTTKVADAALAGRLDPARLRATWQPFRTWVIVLLRVAGNRAGMTRR